MEINGDAVLTLKEVAERIDVSPVTLRMQIERGMLRGVKRGNVWLVMASEADRYKREHKGNYRRPKRQTPTKD